MKKSIPAVLALILLTINAAAQSFFDFIQENAVDIKSDLLFEKTKDYPCIMVGEMHGTSEAAAFLTELVQLSARHGKKIIVGLEIPAADMSRFIKKPTTRNLKKTQFFKQGYGDGRNSQAWFRLIEACTRLNNVELCFFDVDNQSAPDTRNRDSLMFEHLIRTCRKDTTKVIYTLSGNVHNKIKPFRGQQTMGCYLAAYFSADKVMSVNHLYGPGTMYNRTSEGLQVRKVTGQTALFSTFSALENYLLPKLPAGFPDDYSAILYTKTITASLPVYDQRL